MKNHPNTNIFLEKLVGFGNARQRLKKANGEWCRIHNLRNWADNGVKNKFPSENGCGNQIFLEWMRVGGKRVTSEEAYWRFIQRQNGVNIPFPVSRKKPKGKP